LALAEIEPSIGVIVLVDRSGRPDYTIAALHRNELAVRHLMDQRPSGPLAITVSKALGQEGWKMHAVSLDEIPVSAAEIAHQYSRGSNSVNPKAIVLFPFGPKVVNFGLAFALSRITGDSAVAIIPTYVTHGIDYSDGSAKFYISTARSSLTQ
jgi:hypothetical protein